MKFRTSQRNERVMDTTEFVFNRGKIGFWGKLVRLFREIFR